MSLARQMVDRVNSSGGTYHRLDLGPDLVIEGDYDMARYLKHYHLPESMTGMTVLDVGTASGYFALECHRRGAKVTAIDIWDEDCLLAEVSQNLGLDIRYVKQDLYGVDESFGQFDLVVCGSLLLHLPDPVGAARALRSVTGDRLILATTSTPDSQTATEPICHFYGTPASDGDYSSYWTFSALALERLFLAAGYSRVENVEHFDLDTEPGRPRYSSAHVAFSAYV